MLNNFWYQSGFNPYKNVRNSEIHIVHFTSSVCEIINCQKFFFDEKIKVPKMCFTENFVNYFIIHKTKQKSLS